ncbi:hypothetical protein NPIL_557821 [Nephila pilipes]|uniref:Uncharacterized protein n=1 Tax=Nephila pilipes TaxID=299642 RepID=A0A8X6NSX4_NEPPI|nr:hypothetical protein NPIL_557821 [Nephila pilipes]
MGGSAKRNSTRTARISWCSTTLSIDRAVCSPVAEDNKLISTNMPKNAVFQMCQSYGLFSIDLILSGCTYNNVCDPRTAAKSPPPGYDCNTGQFPSSLASSLPWSQPKRFQVLRILKESDVNRTAFKSDTFERLHFSTCSGNYADLPNNFPL